MRLLLILLLLTPSALAQNTGMLAGTVADSTGEALPGATVYLPTIQRGAATDLDGAYRILGIPVGVYEVTFSYTGFASQTIEDVQVSRDRTRQLDALLNAPPEVQETWVGHENQPRALRDDGIPPRPYHDSDGQVSSDREHLPVRGPSAVASLEAGVVVESGSSELRTGGGSREPVVYYVDGVRIEGGAGRQIVAPEGPEAGDGPVWGIVTSLDGQPLVGAIVEARGHYAGTVSGADGAYRIEAPSAEQLGDLPFYRRPGPWLIVVSFPGHVPQTLSVSVEPGQGRRLDVALAPDPNAVSLAVCCGTTTAPLTGTVVDADGAPLAGAFVMLPEVGRTLRAGADGAFHFAAMPVGEVLVQAYRPPSAEQQQPEFAVRIVRTGEPTRLVAARGGASPSQANAFRRYPLGTVRGSVRSAATGRPVPGATLVAYESRYGTNGVASDVDGALDWRNMAPGRTAVRVWAEGYGITTDTVDVRSGATVPLVITLAPEAMAGACVSGDGALVGRVLDATGEPAVGASVLVVGAGNSAMSLGGAMTGHDGNYSALNLPAGTYEVRIGLSAQHAYRRASGVEIPCDRVARLDVTLPPEQPQPYYPPHGWEHHNYGEPRYTQVRGQVFEADTRVTIPGARVGVGGHFTYSDADGRYGLTLLRGTEAMTVSADGYRTHGVSGLDTEAEEPSSADLYLARGAPADTVAVTLTGLSTVTGRVIDWRGLPLAGARVVAGDASTLTGADGRYSLRGLWPPVVTVTVLADGTSKKRDVRLGRGASAELAPIRLSRVE